MSDASSPDSAFQALLGQRDRALASLTGLAIGDALGMPTQSLSPQTIAADYGSITTFIDAGPSQHIAVGKTAGTVTDGTEQALLLAGLVIEGGGVVDSREFASQLDSWERRMLARGSRDLLGPSTKAAVTALLEGDPLDDAASIGTTNGAAMRITPVGIATPSHDVVALVDAVEAVCTVTHHTGLGIAAASAVAAAVSAGIDGASTAEALDLATEAARIGAGRGTWAAGADIAARLGWARSWLPRLPASQRLAAIYEVVGTSMASQESVVAALALASLDEEPWVTLGMAASVGGDTDTIAAMTGAVLGAVHGSIVWPGAAIDKVTRVNGLDLQPVAEGLLEVRRRR